MLKNSIATHLTRLLDLAYWMGAGSAGLLGLLLVWSSVAVPPAPTSFALEVTSIGFSIRPPDGNSGRNVTLALPVAFEMRPETMPGVDLSNLRADARFAISKGSFFPVSLTILLGLMLGTVWIVDQLRQVFRTLRDRNPFVAENAGRIRRIGIGVILIELTRGAGVLYWSYSASSLAGAYGAQFMPIRHLGGQAILYGLIIMAVAEVFREGVRIQEEQSLTI